MIVALWRGRNRCRTAMVIETMRRGTPRVLRHRLMRGHLLGDAALRLALLQRRHLFHGRAGRACGDRRLGLLVTPTEADIGETLQQRQPDLLRLILIDLAWAGIGKSSNFGIRGVRIGIRSAAFGMKDSGGGGSCISARGASCSGNSDGFCAIGRTVTSPYNAGCIGAGAGAGIGSVTAASIAAIIARSWFGACCGAGAGAG